MIGENTITLAVAESAVRPGETIAPASIDHGDDLTELVPHPSQPPSQPVTEMAVRQRAAQTQVSMQIMHMDLRNRTCDHFIPV